MRKSKIKNKKVLAWFLVLWGLIFMGASFCFSQYENFFDVATNIGGADLDKMSSEYEFGSVNWLNCSDSDKGKNFDKFGKVTVRYKKGGKTISKNFPDNCHGKFLQEFFCQGKKYSSVDYECGNYCRDGKCVEDHCQDGVFNEGEEGLDCGGTCSKQCHFSEKCGELITNETWSGNISVSCTVEVPKGKILTIKPGTIVKFKYDRDYRTFDKAGLHADGGIISAVGTPEKRIWFTSSAPDPINGDWEGIALDNSDKSEFKYVIVEFGEMGIEQFDSKVPVRNSIIRWSNAEGLYAERSQPIFENNILYENAYHDIALEQYNTNVQIKNSIFHGGNCAIHNEKTDSFIQGNSFDTFKWPAITAGQESVVSIVGNRFRNTEYPYIYEGAKAKIKNNDFGKPGNPSIPIPKLDIIEIENLAINYLPGSLEDKYPYIYAAQDETRRVIKKIGPNLGISSTLVYVEDFLFKFEVGGENLGEFINFIRIDPKTGAVKRYRNNEFLNPRGLTWDGQFFYVNDFSLLKIFKFKLENDSIKVYNSFDIPNKNEGGLMGLTNDENFLYLPNRNNTKLYKLNKSGNLKEEIIFEGGIYYPLWNGQYFWSTGGCKKGICKYSKEGKLLGEIYPAASVPNSLAWDGKYLWVSHRTCELWQDPKIYQIEILNDSL